MSDANEHTTGITTPKQLIAAIVAGFLVPIICIVLLVQYVVNNNKTGAGSTAQTPAAVAARIQPVADKAFVFKDSSVVQPLQAGIDVYKAVCSACHAAGVAGAPKVGDADSWKARLSQGYDTLLSHALKGIRAMPAKGGNPDLDDIEVARAVVYMANQSGAVFKEPEAKAAPEPAAKTDNSVAPTEAIPSSATPAAT